MASKKFRYNENSMAIQIQKIPEEDHHSIVKVKRYHMPRRQAYQITCVEVRRQNVPKDIVLQMTFKVVIDSVSPES